MSQLAAVCCRLAPGCKRRSLTFDNGHSTAAAVDAQIIAPGALPLTTRGSEMADRWKRLQPTAEDKWKTGAGVRLSKSLRASLEDLVAAFPLEHPHYPASYGPADASITGGNGADWKPVHRAGNDTVSCLPLSALVSQAWVAFAMQYEELSPVALSLSTSVIRQIPLEGRPLREIGKSPGVSALIRHGFVCASGPSGREILWLTERGLDVHRKYEERIHIVETAWRQEFGRDRLAALIAVLKEVGAQRNLPQVD